MVAIDGTHLAGPGTGDAQITVDHALQLVVLAIHQNRHDAEERARRRPGLGDGGAGKRGDQDAAGLGLPPGIDNRAAAFADHVVIPHPGFRIDRLADTSQKTKRRAVAPRHRRVTLAHQGADGGRRRVEDVHLVLLDNLPESRAVGVGRHALEHQRRRAVRKRPVDDVAVACHPADIGGTPVDFTILVVEDILMRNRGIDHVAAGGVKHTLWLPGRS